MIRLTVVGLLLGLTLVGCGFGQQPATTPIPPPSSQTTIASFPTALRIPSIGVNETDGWQPLGLQADGTIEVPPVTKPMQLGWYCPGRDATHPTANCGAPLPGESGPAVVLGHVNGNGHNGVFAKLAKVKKDAKVEIDRSDNRTLTFTVDRVQVILKAKFPSADVYGYSSKPVLRLITCGPGPLHRTADGSRSYDNQTIVYATLTSIRPTKG